MSNENKKELTEEQKRKISDEKTIQDIIALLRKNGCL